MSQPTTHNYGARHNADPALELLDSVDMTATRLKPARVKTARVATAGSAPETGRAAPARSKPNRRAALLHAALDLFATRPYDDVSVDEICARANVAHGLLSYHFGGKRQLFAAAVRLAWDELISYEKPLETEVTVVEKFRGYLSRHFDYFRRHPERFRLMTRSGHADDDVSEVLRSARQDAIKEIEASLGCPEGAPPRLRMAISGWAGFVDTVTLEYIEKSPVDIAEITDMCAQVLVASVRSASDIRVDAAVELEVMSRVVGQANSAWR
ncbi:MAG TPA: TetR/AcrR family transcriptional regulator [Amycolatopsis sp.]|uniref:TetR/AcrR family transcriptional regulator n=1 Tax=Amycolatopsis sp. TaxID=37632 RepID=UPI002B469398|nr:TetR/AcrR family transcriptional regulator [Amycolatopsis sp.]HKS47490.1 TetR/AcrR family transcriptional regulator [Amycolatopsis sp.]